MEKSKIYKNKGVERNKKPLQNIIYLIDIVEANPLWDVAKLNDYAKYKFKDLGYCILYSGLQRNFNQFGKSGLDCHLFCEPDKIKELLGEKQWSKFCSGKREFIIQRRIDGKNKKK